MWHLILPPIIIVVGLGALLWYLSRRLHEPGILMGVERAKGLMRLGSEKRALVRKAFFLKILERTASYFKTTSLRIHNFFQFSLERLRERRKAIDAVRLRERESVKDESPAPAPSRREFPFFRFWKKRKGVAETSEEPVVPISEKRGLIGSDRFATDSGIEETISKPVISEKITRPEQVEMPKDDAREEALIGRIAENPRDAVAYEELGDYYFATRNMRDAKSCYRQALKLHPTNRAVKIKIRRLEKFFEKGTV